MQTNDIARFLIITGIVIAAAGAVVLLLSKFGGINLGRLPGDINIRRENFSFHFPIVTSIVVSVIITIILNLFFRK
ncbi:DUF2905 domain-containing protein [Seleniivibrio sp.]|uniref:DUF2905 domain-containing protein n=1 Tax=Seleniivibrio sp. TaxID=2898801 RepID=UPI0025E00525|nr:DUF2905 domain-containing protein [Seleniivibrio sp.]MCD8553664.1 DUF2905 domain-containing protein [Seleniivibrio sp.]